MTGSVVASVLVVAGLLGACGNKTALRPPEAVQPRPATELAARPTRTGVQLTWRRPIEYTGGERMNDLGGFEIERARGDAGAPEFARIGTLELDDQQRFRVERDMEWTDTTAVPGTRYRYRVIAFTLDGYQSAPAGPVAVQFDPPQVAPSGPGR